MYIYIYTLCTYHTPTARCSPYLRVDFAGLIEGMIVLNSVGKGGFGSHSSRGCFAFACTMYRLSNGDAQAHPQQGREQA